MAANDQVFSGLVLPVRVVTGVRGFSPREEHLLIEHYYGITTEIHPAADLINAVADLHRIEIIETPEGVARVLVDLLRPWREQL
jgi:hypothetical protein